MGLKGGQGNQGQGQYNGYCYQSGQWGHTAKNCESTATVCYNCGQWEHVAKSCTEKRKGKKGKGESRVVESERKGKRKGT